MSFYLSSLRVFIIHFQKVKTAALLAFFMLFATGSPVCAAVSRKTLLTTEFFSQCFQYELTEVSLNGQIIRGMFVNASGKKEIVWLLKLDVPICVDSGGADSINQKAENITRLQLVLTPRDYKSYQKYLTKKVSVGGTLFYGHTQHHFTEVLLSVTTIKLKH